jgi:cell division protein FtsQ
MKIDLNTIKVSKKAALILMVVAFVVVILTIVLSKFWIESKSVTDISVKNVSYIDINELKSIASFAIAEKKDSIDLFNLESEVKKHPFVIDCQASFKPNGNLKLKIIEKKPIAFCSFGNGNIKILDSEGYYLPYEIYEGFQFLPLITGLDHDTKRKYRLEAIKIINQLSIDENRNIYTKITEFSFDDEIKGYKLKLTDMNTEVLFGTSENIKDKIENFEILSKNKLFKKYYNQPEYIDLRWNNKIIVKKS